MAENEYAEGSLEWHAWGHGFDYGQAHPGMSNTPLDGQWAGNPLSSDVIRQAWRDVLGASWDTFTDGTVDDRDNDDDILTAWEQGAASGAESEA